MDALVKEMRRMMREDLEGVNERIDQIESRIEQPTVQKGHRKEKRSPEVVYKEEIGEDFDE